MGRTSLIGLEEAKGRVRHLIRALPGEEVPLRAALFRVLSRGVRARVNSPTDDVSLKDGFAVRARDTLPASPRKPVRFRIVGSRFAGSGFETPRVRRGEAVRITSGAVLPRGSDAVVAGEHCRATAADIEVSAPVEAGQNVLPRGTDVRAAASVGRKGDLLTPGRIGLLAAAGLDRVRVHRKPRVILAATGDEVVEPGRPLKPGQIYASNLFTLSAWLGVYGIETVCRVLPDRKDQIKRELLAELGSADALMTTGGAWGSERDLIVRVLQELGWEKIFHRVRLGPGKAVGFGVLRGRPVFCLPGGPPSNEMAFLQIALPGILRLAGWQGEPFPRVEARLTHPVKGREIDWTQVVRGTLSQDRQGLLWATPRKPASRLESMAVAECLIPVPEGTEGFEAGQSVDVQLLTPPGSPAFPKTKKALLARP